MPHTLGKTWSSVSQLCHSTVVNQARWVLASPLLKQTTVFRRAQIDIASKGWFSDQKSKGNWRQEDEFRGWAVVLLREDAELRQEQ